MKFRLTLQVIISTASCPIEPCRLLVRRATPDHGDESSRYMVRPFDASLIPHEIAEHREFLDEIKDRLAKLIRFA